MRSAIFTAVIALILVYPTNVIAQVLPRGPQSGGEYWRMEFSELSHDDKRSIIAHEVFDEVLSAADKKPGPTPQLVTLDEEGFPWARSLADGTILLTRGAIDICLSASTVDEAKARLAFVIGHELSHQINGDFWHFFFYQGVRPETVTDPEAKRTLDEVVKIARQTDSVITKEMRADQYGVIYASQAGYPVRKIVDNDIDFFTQWAKATSPALLEGVEYSSTHPGIKERSAAIRLALERVMEKIEIFDKGVRAFKKAGYSVAKYYFESFLSVYQSREAFNNLGLVYYMMALDEYFTFSPESPHIALSIIIDPSTRARKTVGKSPFNKLTSRLNPEDHKIRFLRYAQTAEGYFSEAARRDHTYSAARNNLGCVYFLKGESSSAVGEFGRAISLDPKSHEAYNNRAVAYLEMGNGLGVDLSGKALADLEKSLELKKEYPDALYNLAYFHKKRNEPEKSGEYMDRLKSVAPGSRFFTLETGGD